MNDDGLEQLERQQRAVEGNLQHSDTPTIEGSEDRTARRDSEEEKAALFEAGSSGGITTARGLEGAVRNIAYSGELGDLAEGVVPGPDDRLEWQRVGELPKMDEIGLVFEPDWLKEIESEGARETVRRFVNWWKDETILDDDFMVGVYDVSDGGRLAERRLIFGNGEEWHSVGLADVFSVFGMEDGKKRLGDLTEGELEFVSATMLSQMFGKMKIDGVRRPKINDLREGAVKKAVKEMNGDLELHSRIDEIKSGRMKVLVNRVLTSWRGEPLKAKVSLNGGGKREINFYEVPSNGAKLPLEFFLQYCLGGKWTRGQNDTGDYVAFGGFNVDETTTAGELQDHLGEFKLDNFPRKIEWS